MLFNKWAIHRPCEVSVDKGVGLLGKCRLEKRFYRIAHFGVMENDHVISNS